MKIKPRGPDQTTFLQLFNNIIGFHRLAIIDYSPNGDQPFKYIVENTEDTLHVLYLTVNGEIYNYKKLKEICVGYEFKSHSDCEVVLPLFLQFGMAKMLQLLDGEFALAIHAIIYNKKENTTQKKLYLARDRFGIRPLYYVYNNDTFCYSSEMKGLDSSMKIQVCNPREYMEINYNNKISFTTKEYYNIENIPIKITTEKEALDKIYEKFVMSVRNRLESEREIGCLLSGGLDSSLVSAIAAKILQEQNKKLHTFSIGMKNSPDCFYAQKVSDHIGSIHTTIEIPEEQWISAIQKIVEITGTFDITTIRATTGQYLISKWIRENTNIKVLLIGDGSDELTGGYLYFHKAPSDIEFHNETIRLLNNIHMYDVLRADRGIASNGLEARVPFLDHNFVDEYLSIDISLRHQKNKIEKYLLRKAFESSNLLPLDVLWRKKEAFSDGVSSETKSWYKIIQDDLEDKITNSELEKVQNNEKLLVKPHTKEALYYFRLYDSLYPNQEHMYSYYWLPKWTENALDPSARTLNIYHL